MLIYTEIFSIEENINWLNTCFYININYNNIQERFEINTILSHQDRKYSNTEVINYETLQGLDFKP